MTALKIETNNWMDWMEVGDTQEDFIEACGGICVPVKTARLTYIARKHGWKRHEPVMMVNTDGSQYDLPYNFVASLLTAGEAVHGDVFICMQDEYEELKDLSERKAYIIKAWLDAQILRIYRNSREEQ